MANFDKLPAGLTMFPAEAKLSKYAVDGEGRIYFNKQKKGWGEKKCEGKKGNYRVVIDNGARVLLTADDVLNLRDGRTDITEILEQKAVSRETGDREEIDDETWRKMLQEIEGYPCGVQCNTGTNCRKTFDCELWRDWYREFMRRCRANAGVDELLYQLRSHR